ncbi:hypothetical protein WKV44_09935 [Spirochaetia bacterium 38H-sp]|uniref:Periplasmic heavy metal sensor n=1 Tax=Rarispira pelagica TaxID=3141764 RepID=A0ABU9UDW3_9SPIR
MKKEKIIAISIIILIFISGIVAGFSGSIFYFRNNPEAMRILWKKPQTDDILQKRILNLLNLNSTQEEKITEITEKYDKIIKEKEKALRKEVFTELTNMYSELKTILNTEQQKKLEEIIFSRRGKDYIPPPPPER